MENKIVVCSLLLTAKSLMDSDVEKALQNGNASQETTMLIECRNLVSGVSKALETNDPTELMAIIQHAKAAFTWAEA